MVSIAPALGQYSYLMQLCKFERECKAMGLRDKGTVSIEVDGQKYTGEWKATKGLIAVRYVMELETTQIGSEPYPYTALARQLLSELVQRYKSHAK